MMEAVSTFETSVSFYQTPRRIIPAGSHLNPLGSSVANRLIVFLTVYQLLRPRTDSEMLFSTLEPLGYNTL
jgi:hypothetical protein